MPPPPPLAPTPVLVAASVASAAVAGSPPPSLSAAASAAASVAVAAAAAEGAAAAAAAAQGSAGESMDFATQEAQDGMLCDLGYLPASSCAYAASVKALVCIIKPDGFTKRSQSDCLVDYAEIEEASAIVSNAIQALAMNHVLGSR
jgi:hypothetical protein